MVRDEEDAEQIHQDVEKVEDPPKIGRRCKAGKGSSGGRSKKQPTSRIALGNALAAPSGPASEVRTPDSGLDGGTCMLHSINVCNNVFPLMLNCGVRFIYVRVYLIDYIFCMYNIRYIYILYIIVDYHIYIWRRCLMLYLIE
jgi:hypothetical protein